MPALSTFGRLSDHVVEVSQMGKQLLKMIRYRLRRHIVYSLFSVLCIYGLGIQRAHAQTCDSLHFSNPSIEGPGHPTYPEGWHNCLGTSNVQPGLYGCDMPPTEGQRYLGFHSSDAGGERIHQQLTQPTLIDRTYKLIFDIAVVALPEVPALWGGGGFGDHQGYVEIYASTDGCAQDDLVGVTPLLDSSMGWTTVEITFSTSDHYEYLTFVPFDTEGLWTYFTIDNLRNGSYCDCMAGPQTEVEEVICEGDVYTEGENGYTETGLYIDHFESSNGCDSTVITTLEVLPTYHITKEVSICQGLTYSEGNSVYSQTGVYVDHYLSRDDCDSIITTILTAEDQLFFSDTIRVCADEQAFVAGAWRTESGSYSETFTALAGCDSTIITFLEIQSSALTQQQILRCTDEPLTIGAKTYHESGYFADTLSNRFGCDSIVHTELMFMSDEPILPEDATLCLGEQVYVDLSHLQVDMMFWTDGFTSPFISVEESGMYWLDLHWADCHLSDTLHVLFHETPPADLDTVICSEKPLEVNLTYLGGEILWENGDVSPERSFDRSGTFIANIDNQCGSFDFMAGVEAEYCECPIYSPTTFTPDGNGLNDSFTLECQCDFAKYELHVFDRNGDVIFRSFDPEISWTGTTKGSNYAVVDGEYHWILNYAAITTQGELVYELLRGSVSVMR